MEGDNEADVKAKVEPEEMLVISDVVTGGLINEKSTSKVDAATGAYIEDSSSVWPVKLENDCKAALSGNSDHTDAVAIAVMAVIDP